MSTPSKPETRTISVDYLARVEGEGNLKVRVRDGKAEITEFGIFEPPRFYEAFLRGRLFRDAPDITARICGICPIAYQMSSVHAMESIFGVKMEGALRELRRLIYCGEWIESHVLHAFMLHLPDFLGYQSAIHMAADHREAVEKALKLKKIGNDIVALLGGREIHPINVKVGGWYKVPTKRQVLEMVPNLEWALDAATWAVEFAAGLPFPEIEQDYEYVSVCHPDEYPYNEGRLVSNKGIDIPVSEWGEVFEEVHVARSNALQSKVKARGSYHVGPLARYSLNFEKLSPRVQRAAAAAGLGPTCFNPFKSIVVRCLETLHAVEEALRIIDAYKEPSRPDVPFVVKAGEGHGASEAPRGMLYHRYRLDDEGYILDAQIAPPTAQSQMSIEDDLRKVLETSLDLPDDQLQWRLEQTVRNYDPCISCATHFLKVEIDRG
ncbi:MAG: putative NiFe hydrogenase alpha subunit [Actinobacteria bacterium]|nr:putative NiFe hydrogenase alpha subunit [Actinomycetota bacterium]